MKTFCKGICLVLCLLHGSFAWAQSRITDDYKIYDNMGTLSIEMFGRFLSENRAQIHTAAVLKACSMEGLAQAVESKIRDRKFEAQLKELIQSGKFSEYPPYAFLQAQSGANSMAVGYMIGYREAASLNSQKKALCEVAVDSANRLLGK
jgi:hypothetical protein